MVFGVNSEEKIYSIPKRDTLVEFAKRAKAMNAEIKLTKNPLIGFARFK